MRADLTSIRKRWAPAFDGFASTTDLPLDGVREKLTQALDDVHELLKLAELLRDFGDSLIAIEQATRSAVAANNPAAELALANLRNLHDQVLDVLNQSAMRLAAEPVPSGAAS